MAATQRFLVSLSRSRTPGLHFRAVSRSYSGWRGSGSGSGRGRFFGSNWKTSSACSRPFLLTSLSLGSLFSARGKRITPQAPPPCNSTPALPPSVPIEISRMMLPDDTNPSGNVHGGTILKLIEEAAAVVASRHCNQHREGSSSPLVAVLARVEHMDFHQPMFVGEVAQLQAAVTYTSPHSMEVAVDVWAENVLTGNRRHTNTAMLWYVAFPWDVEKLIKRKAKVAEVPRLKRMSEDEVKEGAKRYEEQKLSRLNDPRSKKLTHFKSCYPTSDAPEHTVLASQSTLTSVILPSDCTSTGHLMGGPLMKMMDNAAGICAARHSRSVVVTASIDAIDFHHPVYNGEVVFCTARLVFCSSRSMEVEVITEAEGLLMGSRRLTNTAYFTFVSLGDDLRACPVPPLEVTNEEERKRFEEGRERYEARKRKRSELNKK